MDDLSTELLAQVLLQPALAQVSGLLRQVCRQWRDLLDHRRPGASGRQTAPSAMVACVPLMVWARANGCPWDVRMCQHAAEAGHLDVLQWARANGCPWESHVCGEERTPRRVAVGPCKRGAIALRGSPAGRRRGAPGGAAVGP
eukprot:m.47521 g.47521  ORF g.47521 m.47521 type:complete len:143 (+) comp6893_c1_seq1:86-514(+)